MKGNIDRGMLTCNRLILPDGFGILSTNPPRRSVTALFYNAHLDWFHTYLGGDAAPYDMTKMLRNQAVKDK